MCQALSKEAMAAVDRMDSVAVCWAALADLMSGDHDLPAIARDNLAVLMGFLEEEYRQARAALTMAVKGG